MKNYGLYRYSFLAVLFVFMFTFASVAAVAAEKKLTPEEKLKLREEAAKRMHLTEWTIELSPMSGDKKDKPYTDTLTFQDKKLHSEALAEDEYADSNMTINVKGDTIIWETMQSIDGKNPVFWRGEIRENTVSGVMSRQDKEGETKAFSFRGEELGKIEPPAPPAPVVEEVVEQAVEEAEEIVDEAIEEVKEAAEETQEAAKEE